MKRIVMNLASLVLFSGAASLVQADDLMQSAQQTFKPIPSVRPSRQEQCGHP